MKKILLFFCLLSFTVMQLAAQCDAPTNVQATARWDKVNLTWESSLQSVTYDDSLTYGGTESSGIGAGTSVFSCVVRFTPDSLTSFSGMYLTHVKFNLYSLNFTYVTVKVWQGGSYTNGTFNEGTLVCSTPTDPSALVAGENIVRLSTPVLVDPNQELWIGFETQGSGSSTYPASATNNMVDNFNNLIYFGSSWTTLVLANEDLTYGWIISGCFSNSTPDITGFNVYRDNTMVNTTPILDHFYTDEGLTPETQYCYTVESVCSATTNSSQPVCVTTTTAPNCGTPIGTGTGTFAYLPFYCYYNYSYSQQLYTASEMGPQAGTIVSLAFPYMYSSPQTFVNVKVYMANVNKTTFSSATDWIPGNDLTLVYDGPYSCNATDTFSTILFDSPFEWDGISNVVVAIAYNEGSYTTSDPRFYSHTATAGNTSLYVYQDASAYNPFNPPSGTLTNSRNNILFCYGPEPDCYKPAHPELSNITSSSATLSWTPHSSNDTQFDIVCVEAGQNVNSGTIIPVQDSTYTITGLTDNTTYDVYLRTNCSPDFSDWIKLTFHTECLTYQTLPYTENFNGYGSGGEDTYPFCWFRNTNYTTTNYPYVTTNGQLYFYSYENYYSLAVSQAIDLSSYAAGTLALSFYIGVANATYGRLDVGVMTNPYDLNTFTLLKSYYPSDYHSVGTFQHEFITLTESYQTPIYLAFYAPAPVSSTTNYVNVDNVRVDYLPTCSNPSYLTISNVTGTAAQISWTPAQYGATGYILEYGEAGQTLTPITTTDNQYMLTGLTTNTEYEVHVYATCADGTSDTLDGGFTTLNFVTCTQPDTSGLVVADSTLSTTTTYQVPVNNLWKYTYSQEIIPASAIGSSTVLTGIGFYYDYSTSMTDKTNVKIYLAHRTSNSFASTTDWTPISEATLVYEGHLNCSQGWNVFDFDTYFPYNGNDNLVVIVDDNSGDYNSSSYVFRGRQHSDYRSMYYYSDSTNPDPENPPTGSRGYVVCDMKLFTCGQTAPLTCPEPMAYTTASDNESVTVAWIANGSESEWELQYKDASSNTWTSAGSVFNSPYTISNLNPDTQYDIRLCAVCSATDSSEWSYTTAYTPCVSIDIPYFEDFENQTANQKPGCWMTLSNTSSPTPVVNATQGASGNKSLYFYCPSSGNYAYGILPRFEDAVDMTDLQIQFQAYKTSDAYMIEVGVMTDPTDVSTFMALGSFSPSVNNTWELGEVLTNNYNGNGHYVAFRIPQWYANSIYIDDVDVQNIPFCPHVNNIFATNIEATTAVVKWTAGDSETQWAYIYGPEGTVDVTVDNPNYCNEDSVLLSNLIPNTLYTIYVQAYCSTSEQSSWMHYSFRTGCATMTQLPYSENFDSYVGTTSSSINVLPNCWSRINTGSSYTGYPTVYSSSAHSGANCMAFYVYNSSYYADQYAILPEIDTVALPINSLQMSLSMASMSSSYTFSIVVGVMSDPTDASTFIPVQTISTASYSYTNQNVYFDGFTGGGQYIALKVPVPTGSYNYGYIDDIVLSLIPECSPVSDLTVSSITGTSALVTWQAGHYGNITGYTLEYSEAGQDNWSIASNSITGTSYLLSNLDPSTSYDVRVLTNCDNISSSAAVKTFSTSCLAGGNVTIGEETSTYSYLPSYSFYNYSYTQQIYTASELGSANTFNSISFNVATVNTPNRTLSIYLMHTTESAPGTWLPASNAQLVFSGAITLVTGWNTFVFSTPFVYNGTDNLAVIVVDGTGSYSSSNSWYVHTAPAGAGASMYAYTDSAPYSITSAPSSTNSSSNRNNIILGGNCDSLTTCIAPNFFVDNITTNSADITWANGYMESAWEMDYKVHSDSLWTPVANPAGYHTQLTNLQSNTLYDVRMRSDCGSELSAYRSTSFRTECGTIATLPFQENFDSYGTGTNAYPFCWDKINNYSTDMPYITSTYVSAPASLYFYAGTNGTYNMAITPEFDASIAMNTLQVSFMYKASSSSDRLVVGVMTDPADENTFTPIDTVYPDPSSASTWIEKDVYLSGYQGNGHYIAFLNGYTTSYAYAYIDDLVINLAPSCLKPSNFSVTCDVTSATLSWTENGTATAWDIEYGAQGFTQGTGTMVSANTNPFTISGLTTGTTYDFYVRANCGSGDESDWTNAVPGAPGSYILPSSGDYTLTMCGGIIYDDGGINGNYSNSSDVTLVINPDTEELMVHLTGTYNIETGSSSRWDYLQIFDGNTTSGTLLFDSHTDNSGTLDVMSTTGPLTLYFHSDGSTTYSGFELQVSCDSAQTPPEPCNAPTNVAISNVTHNSADVDWAQEGTPDSWTVSYKKGAAATWTTVTTTTHPYTITNLEPETSYTVFVTANCGDQTSDASAQVPFVTGVGVNDYVLDNTVVYPNPTTGEFSIENSVLRIDNVEVYDVYGKLIKTIEVNDNSVNIDLSGNASGVYFTRIYTEMGTMTVRVVKN